MNGNVFPCKPGSLIACYTNLGYSSFCFLSTWSAQNLLISGIASQANFQHSLTAPLKKKSVFLTFIVVFKKGWARMHIPRRNYGSFLLNAIRNGFSAFLKAGQSLAYSSCIFEDTNEYPARQGILFGRPRKINPYVICAFYRQKTVALVENTVKTY